MGEHKFKLNAGVSLNMEISQISTVVTIELKLLTLNAVFGKQGLNADCLFLPLWLFN